MRRVRRRRNPNYLFPFLALVGLGVVVVLVYQLWNFFFVPVKGDAVFYAVEERSKMLSFGSDKWENAYNGVKIKLGDSLKTPPKGKAVVKFYDETLLRLGEDTEISLVDITKKPDHAEILVSLKQGTIWVNKPKTENIKSAEFVVHTSYANYNVTGTIFTIEKGSSESLKVLKGTVMTDIIEEDQTKRRVIDSIPVGIGQQIDLDEAVMKRFYARENPPSVLKAIDEVFKTSPWYIWNAKEDESPTDFSQVRSSNENTPENNNASTPTNETNNNTPPSQDNGNSSPQVTDQPSVETTLEPLTITSPQQSSVDVETDKLSIAGTAATGTQKIYVLQKVAQSSKEEKIFLTRYQAGSSRWTYNLSEAYKNIAPGKNEYTFVAIDQNGFEAKGTSLTVNYNKKKVEITDPLKTPLITSVDGKPYTEGMTVTNSNFQILGTVQGAEAVVVNGYTLSQFVPGAKRWAYNIKESIGNLKPGLNTYQVYAIDPEGNKTEIQTVKINYEKPQSAESTTSSTSGGDTTSSSASSSATSANTTTSGASSSTPSGITASPSSP